MFFRRNRVQWKWQKARTLLASKWAWVEAQVADIDTRLKRVNFQRRESRTNKGQILFGYEEQLPARSFPRLVMNSSNSNSSNPTVTYLVAYSTSTTNSTETTLSVATTSMPATMTISATTTIPTTTTMTISTSVEANDSTPILNTGIQNQNLNNEIKLPSQQPTSSAAYDQPCAAVLTSASTSNTADPEIKSNTSEQQVRSSYDIVPVIRDSKFLDILNIEKAKASADTNLLATLAAENFQLPEEVVENREVVAKTSAEANLDRILVSISNLEAPATASTSTSIETNNEIPVEEITSMETPVQPQIVKETNTPDYSGHCMRTLPFLCRRKRHFVNSKAIIGQSYKQSVMYSTAACTCSIYPLFVERCVSCCADPYNRLSIEPDCMPIEQRMMLLDSGSHPNLAMPSGKCRYVRFLILFFC